MVLVPLYDWSGDALREACLTTIRNPDRPPVWILAGGRLFVRDLLGRYVRRPDLERDEAYLTRQGIDPAILWVSRRLLQTSALDVS